MSMQVKRCGNCRSLCSENAEVCFKCGYVFTESAAQHAASGTETAAAPAVQGAVTDEQASTESMRAEMAFKKRLRAYQEQGVQLTESMEAALFAQCVELQLLKAPATAIFPDLDEMVVNGQGSKYVVSGFVDAQNGNGALIRGNYTFSVIKEGDRWKCTDQFVDTSTSVRKEMNEAMKDISASVAVDSIIWWVLGIIGTVILILIKKAAWGF